MWGSCQEKQEFGALYPLLFGLPEERNTARAMKGIIRLAENGYIPAVYALGFAYFEGKGVSKDLNTAFDMYLRAAKEEYPSAECGVGNFYAMAFPKHDACCYDPEQAVEWYTRAARHGNSGAQCNLAHCYLTGHGVAKDPVEAYLWATLAVHCSPVRFRPAEVFRDQAAALLNDENRQEVGRRIGEMKKQLPYVWSEHLSYWRLLHDEAQVVAD